MAFINRTTFLQFLPNRVAQVFAPVPVHTHPCLYHAEAFDVAAGCTSASPDSRDFYDVFATHAGGLALVLGNASGRGTPATTLMGAIHPEVRTRCWMESPLHHETATSRINRRLCGRTERAHEAAMFWAYFDPPNQLLRYVNAGHTPPLLFKADRRRVLLRLRTGGPILGLLPHLSFQQGAVRLDPGDTLVLYSEGILNAANPHEEPYGEERLRAAVANSLDGTAEEIRARILSSVGAFTRYAAPDEDRTLVVVRYSGARCDVTEPSPETPRTVWTAA